MAINNTVTLGIDYSYEETGFAVSHDNEVIVISCLNFKSIEKKIHRKLTKKEKRSLIVQKARRYIEAYDVTCIVCEQIRLFSRGFISITAIIAFARIIGSLIDTCIIPIYSVDTRVWKKRIHGSAKAQKSDTIAWAKKLLTIEIQEKRAWKQLTDNEADATALSLFAYHPEASKFLKEEE